MSRLVIVGAGPFARELYSWIRRTPSFLLERESIGFIDDNERALTRFTSLAKSYLGSIVGYQPRVDDRCLLSVVSPKTKPRIIEMLDGRGAQFVSFIDSSVIVSDDVTIGRGSIVCPNAVLSCNSRLGDFVSVNLGTTVGHDAVVGDYTSLMSHVDITGGVHLGRSVFVGSHATILPGVSVGDEAIVGAGSAVIRRVAASVTVTGVPAQRIFGTKKKPAQISESVLTNLGDEIQH